MMRWAAIAIVCNPLEQKRLTVTPATETGRPARSATWRAMLAPVAPSGLAQPISTSSTSAPSMPARSSAAFTAWPPSSAPCVMLKAPFQLLQSGVRAVETMTASVMGNSWNRKLFRGSHALVGRALALDRGGGRRIGPFEQLAPRAGARDEQHAQHDAGDHGQGAGDETLHGDASAEALAFGRQPGQQRRGLPEGRVVGRVRGELLHRLHHVP